MPSQFQSAGAQPSKPTRYAPLHTNRFWTGLWTQRSPLRDAASEYLAEKYYGAGRNESIITDTGNSISLNTEITPRLTLARRPGLSVYNSASLSAPVNLFQEYRYLNANGSEGVRILADIATTPNEGIWDVTPNAATGIFSATGAYAFTFQQAGRYMYYGDGVEVGKSIYDPQTATWTSSNWGIAAPTAAPTYTSGTVTGITYSLGYETWRANHAYTQPYLIIDSVYNDIWKLSQNGTSQNPGPPAWTNNKGDTVTDGGCIWENLGNAYLVASDSPTSATAFAYAYKRTNNTTINGSTVSTPEISTASPVSTPVVYHLEGGLFMIQGAYSTEATVDRIQLYRYLAGGSKLLLIDEISNNTAGGTWTYLNGGAGGVNHTDHGYDENLNEFIEASLNGDANPPPAGLTNLEYHLDRMWGSVGNTVYYSVGPNAMTGTSGNSGFPAVNTFSFPSKVVRLWAMALGLLVFTTSDIYVISGAGTSGSLLYSVPFVSRIGLLSYYSFDVSGSTAYMVTTDKQLLSLDPGAGIVEIGFPIGDLLQTAITTQLAGAGGVYLAAHSQGTDRGLFVTFTGGSGGWYRMAQTSAPESGLNWSPFAQITGGCGPVQSIQTSTGVRTLLVGPGTIPGQILKRDPTVSQDNGSSFAAKATLGSIVLCQPGQIADVNFITTEVNSGASQGAPTLKVWFEENGAAANAPSPTTLSTSTPDPPELGLGTTYSTTLRSDRFYATQAQVPVSCRHLQLQISWGSTNTADELLSYTIYGTIRNEL